MNPLTESIRSTKKGKVPRSQRPGPQAKHKFQCEECMKCFSSNQSLNEHRNLHKNARPYKCHICEKCFRYGSQLCIHRRNHHSAEDIRFPKLTDLLRCVKSEESGILSLTEIVRLPLITGPQAWVLPSVEGLWWTNE